MFCAFGDFLREVNLKFRFRDGSSFQTIRGQRLWLAHRILLRMGVDLVLVEVLGPRERLGALVAEVLARPFSLIGPNSGRVFTILNCVFLFIFAHVGPEMLLDGVGLPDPEGPTADGADVWLHFSFVAAHVGAKVLGCGEGTGAELAGVGI